MGHFIEDLQYKIKTSSSSLMLKAFILFIGFMLGLTFSLIGQQMLGYGTIGFTMVIVTTLFAFYKVAKGWTWSQAAIFAFICVLIATLLNMYIQLAPGA